MQTSVQRPPAVIDLLPMFRDNAHSVSMVKHGMDLLQKTTLCLNPGQDTVFTLDQPLYTIAKKIQWTFSNLYGEKSFIIMMGRLHIEMAYLSVLRQWLAGSGWSCVMSEVKVTTEDRVLGVEKGSLTSQGQRVHQVTLAALLILKREAYNVIFKMGRGYGK